jgi:hypothetical protein
MTKKVQTASEQLRLREEKDRLNVESTAELEQKLLEGIASLDRGEGIEGEEAFKRLRQRAQKSKKQG